MKAFKKLFDRSPKTSNPHSQSTSASLKEQSSTTAPIPPPAISAKSITSMAKQTIVVFGATGKQGGSVVKTILADTKTSAKYHVKAVTRDTTKDSAQKLRDLGAEVVSV